MIFKVGDKVKVVKNGCFSQSLISIGDIGVITKIYNGCLTLDFNGLCQWCSDYSFIEPVEKKKSGFAKWISAQ